MGVCVCVQILNLNRRHMSTKHAKPSSSPNTSSPLNTHHCTTPLHPFTCHAPLLVSQCKRSHLQITITISAVVVDVVHARKGGGGKGRRRRRRTKESVSDVLNCAHTHAHTLTHITHTCTHSHTHTHTHITHPLVRRAEHRPAPAGTPWCPSATLPACCRQALQACAHSKCPPCDRGAIRCGAEQLRGCGATLTRAGQRSAVRKSRRRRGGRGKGQL